MSAPREPKRLDPPRGGVHDDGMDSTPTWFTGQLLLALPGIGDPRFEQAVIAMVSHDEDGAMGIGIGAPMDGMTVGAVLDQLDIAHDEARTDVGQGRIVSVRVVTGGRRISKKTNKHN